MSAVERGGVSSVERGLAAVVELPASGAGSCVVDTVHPALLWARGWEVEPAASSATELDRLLSAGARPLARAAAAAREIARLSAVMAASLAEFARCRPATSFDRQPGERGAMSAATRAAPGWRFEESGDGGLAVTMPDGEVRVSHPPRFGTDLDIAPY
jgi:hypothetical protein